MPFLFRQRAEPEELHQVFAHHQIGIERHMFAHPRQGRERPFRTMHDVADAAGIDQHMIRRAQVDPARDLADHARAARATASDSASTPP